MSLINLNPKEVEVIKESIELRRNTCEGHSELSAHLMPRLDDILKKVNLPIIDLNPSQRSLLIGCIREYIIYPNEDLFKLSDYEIFCSIDQLKDRMRQVDIGSSAINKLKKKGDRENKIFEDVLEKGKQLASTQKVYYSDIEDEKIYKIGIVVEKGKGIKIEDSPILENFKFQTIEKDWFMSSASPKEVIKKIEVYELHHKLTENLIRVKEILKKGDANNNG